jgi:RNA polymerase sigma factor (sigma-70 family)
MSQLVPELLTQLFDEHSAALVLYARQWCDAPEDVVQEAFLRLVRQTPAPANAVGWMYRVVRNRAISVSRATQRREGHEAAAARGTDPWFEATEEERLDADSATAALIDLPIEQRETIVARLWGGLSLEEVAELTGTSKSTAHRRYQAGLAALQERLGVACPKKTKNFRRS